MGITAPEVRIAQRADRLEARARRARQAADAGLMVEALEHELCIEIHVREMVRLSAKYEVPLDLHALLHMILREVSE